MMPVKRDGRRYWPYAKVRERLKRARQRAQITTVDAANHLGVRRPAIWEMETGKRKISARELRSLSRLYGVSPEWLLGKTTRMRGEDPADQIAEILAGLDAEALELLGKALQLVSPGSERYRPSPQPRPAEE